MYIFKWFQSSLNEKEVIVNMMSKTRAGCCYKKKILEDLLCFISTDNKCHKRISTKLSHLMRSSKASTPTHTTHWVTVQISCYFSTSPSKKVLNWWSSSIYPSSTAGEPQTAVLNYHLITTQIALKVDDCTFNKSALA